MQRVNRVRFLDVAATYHELRSELDLAIREVLEDGPYILGSVTESFECEFANYVSASRCVGVANGLDALRLALRALGVAEGDDVIVSGHTFVATWLAISQCGARAIPVDAETDGFNIDPQLIEDRITSRTKAIVIVHLYGQPADIDAVHAIAKRYGIPVVEDAAQAHGAKYKSVPIGSHSSAIAWSFYPSKNLGAFGDGGAVTTSHSQIAERVRMEANYGSKSKYEHIIKGSNSRLDSLQAAVLRVKLRYLDEWNRRRNEIASYYLDQLRDCTGVRLPQVRTCSDHVWHLFVVELDQRDYARNALLKAGIETGVHYPIPPHLQECYQQSSANESLPRTNEICQKALSLPIGPHMTMEAASTVVRHLVDIVGGQ